MNFYRRMIEFQLAVFTWMLGKEKKSSCHCNTCKVIWIEILYKQINSCGKQMQVLIVGYISWFFFFLFIVVINESNCLLNDSQLELSSTSWFHVLEELFYGDRQTCFPFFYWFLLVSEFDMKSIILLTFLLNKLCNFLGW